MARYASRKTISWKSIPAIVAFAVHVKDKTEDWRIAKIFNGSTRMSLAIYKTRREAIDAKEMFDSKIILPNYMEIQHRVRRVDVTDRGTR